MIIIDNCFEYQQVTALRSLVEKDVAQYNNRLEKYDDETDHHEFHNCGIFDLHRETRNHYLRYLVDKKLLHNQCVEGHDHMLRYHQMRYPYHSTWHKDRLTDWESDQIDYIGVTYFLDNDWNPLDGGLFLFKESKEASIGKYVEPIHNRIVINDQDLYHAVTRINKLNVTRTSLQMSIHKKYLIV
jgi:hypothetical protein